MKGFFLPAIAALGVLVLGFALVVFLPTPEERAFEELLHIHIPSIRWHGVTPREAVAELNAEIQKRSNTGCRFILAEGARSDIPVVLELNDVLAVECAEYLGQESGNGWYLTPHGIVIDGIGKERAYDRWSWRLTFRHWITSTVPKYWRRLRGQPDPDPIWGFALNDVTPHSPNLQLHRAMV